LIDNELKPELLAYIGGIVREIKGSPLKINGLANHIHLLVQFPPILSIAEAMRTIKANSSRWVHQNWNSREKFAWQLGYGAFSVSRSAVPTVVKYIENQEEHHQKRSFQTEFISFLNKHGVVYDERYIWQ
jgi:REP element-mobilizing transposase RayT